MTEKLKIVVSRTAWAFRRDPRTAVRVLCVDGPDEDWPVTTVDVEGDVRFHSALGAYKRFKGGKVGVKSSYDLVPRSLVRK